MLFKILNIEGSKPLFGGLKSGEKNLKTWCSFVPSERGGCVSYFLIYSILSKFNLLYAGENAIFWQNGNLRTSSGLVFFTKHSSSNIETPKRLDPCQEMTLLYK